MRFWMLIPGIALVSVLGDLNCAVSRSGNTIASAQETEPTPTPGPEMEGNFR